MDERQVIQRVLDGDQEAFAGLVTAYEKQVYNLCLRMCGNQEDARDLSQEAFVKAWRGLQFYQFEAAFSTWLYRLTSNVCIDFLRRKKRAPQTVPPLQNENGEDVEPEVADSLPGPEEQLLHRERQSQIAWAMGQLEPEFRQVLTLRVIQELSYEQIAEITELKVGTVKSRIARARWKLKKILLESGNNFGWASSEETERRERHDL